MNKSVKTGAFIGLITAGFLNPALADSESPDFSFSSQVLTLPNVLVDSAIWYSDVQIELNFDTGEFRLLGADAGDESSFEIRLSNLEDLVVDAVTTDEEADISARLLSLEEKITSPISIEGSTLRQRISALESVLSPPEATTNLVPGRYTDPSGWCYDLTGPFVLTDDRVNYFIQYCDNETTFVAEITSGPVAGHPQLGDRLDDLSMPDNRVYGLVTARTNFGNSPLVGWTEGEIMGFRRAGDEDEKVFLTFELYSNGSTDVELPLDTVTLTLQTDE